MIDLQDIITTKRELLSRETYSRNPINYSAGMAEDQKDRYIQYLAEQNQDLRLTGDAMRLVLEDFMAQMKELKDQMSSMQSKHVDLENRLSEEHKLRKSAERKIKSLQEKLDYANQERFGDRRQKIQSKAKTSDSDRRKEKDDYDGTDDTLRTDSVGHVPSQELKEPSGKDRDLSNRPDGYKTMGVAGEATEHPSDLTKVPGRIIERRMVRVFSFRTFLTEECFEMVHYNPELHGHLTFTECCHKGTDCLATAPPHEHQANAGAYGSSNHTDHGCYGYLSCHGCDDRRPIRGCDSTGFRCQSRKR